MTSIRLTGQREAGRRVLRAEIAKLSSRELAKVRDDLLQRFHLKTLMKYDRVKVCRHDDVGVDPHPFLAVTKVEAVRHNLEGCFGNEDGQPLDNAEGDKVQRAVRTKPITFHNATSSDR